MNRRCTQRPAAPTTIVVVAQPSDPPKTKDDKSHIYNKVYRSYRELLAANCVGKEDRRVVMIMLTATWVDFDREKTRVYSRQKKELVDQVFDNLEANGIWHDGKWRTEFDPSDQSEDNLNLLSVQFALHLLCAQGVAHCDWGDRDEPKLSSECNGGSDRGPDAAGQGDPEGTRVGCEERAQDPSQIGSCSEQGVSSDSEDGSEKDTGGSTQTDGAE